MAVYEEQTPLPNKFRPIIQIANQWTANGAPRVNRVSHDEISTRMTPSAEEEKKNVSKNLTKNTGAVKDIVVVSSSLTKKRNQFCELSPSDNFDYIPNTKWDARWDKGYCYNLHGDFYTILAGFWENNKNSISLIPCAFVLVGQYRFPDRAN